MNSISDVVSIFPSKKHCFISIVGGGGKTTIMQNFASELMKRGKTVLMTTSTKVQSPECFNWQSDYIFTDEKSAFDFYPKVPCVVLYAHRSDIPYKLVSPSFECLSVLSERYDYILCEADGSRHFPVKIHTERDPVIYGLNDFSVCIFGAWATGKKASECTFGPLNDKIGCYLDSAFLEWYLTCEEGLLKRTEKGKRCIVVTKSEDLTAECRMYFEMQHETVFFC